MANIINFNKDEERQQGQGADASTTAGSAGPATITPVGAPQGQGPQATAPGAASSGKFTNIQKYIGANKGAGQQVATGINKQQDKSLQAGRIAQSDEAKKVAAGVQQANTTLDRGQGYLNQINQDPNFRKYQAPVAAAPQPVPAQAPMGDTVGIGLVQQDQPIQPVQAAQAAPAVPSFNAEEFVSDNNRLQDFTKLKVGQGIDEVALQTQAQKSQDLANVNKVSAQELSNQSKTESGRFGLIGQAFARPNYTQGQKRLDNLFLTGSGNKSIESIQNKGKENLNTAQNTATDALNQYNTSRQIGTTEADLQKNLQERSTALESGLLSNLESFIPQTNQDRDALRSKWQTNFNTLVGKGEKDSQISDDIWNELQLQQGERTYNVLNDPNLTLRQIADVSDRNAVGFGDIANQSDVNQYSALARLAQGGLDQSGNYSFDPAGLKLTKASDMEAAAKAKQGDGSLRDRLDDATEAFIKKAKDTTVIGTGSDRGTSSIFGGGSTANAQFDLNLGKYLGTNDLINADGTTTRQDRATMYDQVRPYTDPVGSIIGSGALGNGDIGNLFSNLANTPASIVNNLMSNFGLSGGSGSGVAANARARQDLLNNLTSTLSKDGYNNYLTRKGNINTDSVANAARNVETQRLSDRNDNNYFGNPLNTKEQQNNFVNDKFLEQLVSRNNGNKDISLLQSELQNARSGGESYQTQLGNQVADNFLQNNMINGDTRNFKDQYGQPAYYNQLSETQKQVEREKFINPLKQNQQTVLDGILSGRQATEKKYNDQQENLRNELNRLRGLPQGYTGK